MKKVLSLVLLALVALVAVLWWRRGGTTSGNGAHEGVVSASSGKPSSARPAPTKSRQEHATRAKPSSVARPAVPADENVVVTVSDSSTPLTEEEKREAAEDKLVEEFDASTDHWMDAEKTKPPTMEDIEAFHAKFSRLPKARKEECLQRALNLVPDQNVMLLVGILMDKSEDKDLVELVYNDILNRDEIVKKPILQQIFKDKSHPCWADTAWILDVTGEAKK